MSRWSEAALGDICEITIGKTPPRAERKYWGGGMPWLSIADMNQGRDLRVTKEQVTSLAADGPAGRLVQPGTLLLSFKLSVGKVGFSRVPMYTNEAIAALSIKDETRTHPDFLYWALKCADLLRDADDAAMGKNLNKKKLAEFVISLPPPAEQRRIAAVLDQVDILRAKRREAIALLDDLAQSIFFDMFGNPVEVIKKVPLSSIANIASGITKGRKEPSGELQDVPYLAVVNVQDRKLNLSTVKEIPVSVAELERFRLQSEDLLLTEGGDPDKLGRGTLWREELPVCIHQNHVFRVRVMDREKIDPVYLNWVMSSSYGKRYFLRTAKQTTGIASINKSQLGAFPLPVSPIVQQREFRSRIEKVQAHQQAHRLHLAALDELFTSLQHRAFSGTLWDHEALSDAA